MMGTLELDYHLSRVLVGQRSGASPYAAHRAFWRAYAANEPPAGTPQPFRFRHEPQAGAQGHRCFLVQSRQQPDWCRVDDVTAESKRVRLAVKPGSWLHFAVECPVYLSQVEGARRWKRPLFDGTEIENWFDKRAREAGFEAPRLAFDVPRRERFEVPAREGVRPHSEFKLNVVRFDGMLRVMDLQRFALAVHDGFGPKPALGFGLLSVMPVD